MEIYNPTNRSSKCFQVFFAETLSTWMGRGDDNDACLVHPETQNLSTTTLRASLIELPFPFFHSIEYSNRLCVPNCLIKAAS
jgi:hypothetical protein